MSKKRNYLIIVALALVLAMMLGISPVTQAQSVDLVITGLIDGPLTGGVPKAAELYVINDIADLSVYGLGSANNGGGSDGEEFTFPADAATAGSYIYVASEAVGFNDFFGFDPDYTSGAMAINGDDAVELFQSGLVVDVFGDINVDGTGQPWDHLDGWAYRVANTGPDGSTFVLANWTFSGPNALDNEISNATAAVPFPIGTYSLGTVESSPAVVSTNPGDGDTNVAIDADIVVNFSEDVVATDPWAEVLCTTSGSHTTAVSGGPQSFTLNPDTDFVNDESCTVTISAAQVTDVDTDDPPDNMDADYVFSFTTPSTAAAGIVINEILADPAGDLTGDANGDGTRDSGQDEFVEIVNNSGGPVDISGWSLSDDDTSSVFTFPANTILPDQCAAVLFGGGTPTGTFGGALVFTDDNTIGTGLSNGGDTIVLNNGTTDVATYTYGSEGGNNQSLTLDPDVTGTNFVQHSGATGSGGALFSPGTMIDGSPFSGCPVPAPDVFINEVRIGLTGSPDADFFEIQGAAGTSLDGLTYVVLSGEFEPGSVDYAIDLTGSTIPADGFFVAGGADTAGAYGITPDLSVEFDFFGSPTTHMIVSNFTGSSSDDLDTNNDGILDSTPWTDVADSVAFIDGDGNTDYSYSSAVVGPDGNFTPAGTYRCDDAPVGTFDNNQLDFNSTNGTPGESNASLCSPPVSEVKIHDVQGNGSASPIVGDTVLIEGIVVGDFQAQEQFSGFHVQEEDADADMDAATSEGVFVYHYSTDVSVGDLVRVTGTVAEYNGLTELTSVTNVEILSSGNDLPAATAVSLPVTSADDFEKYEGMLVTFPQTLYINEFFNFDRYGEIVLGSERHFQPTAVYEPGSIDAANLAQANALSRITLDDGRSDQNPDPARHPNGANFELSNTFRGGDTVENVTGVMDYAFGAYKIQPTIGADYVSVNMRPEAPEVGGSVKVASFNVLNYFTTLDTDPFDDGPFICGPLENLGCRGANDVDELNRQRDKIVAALLDIDADVVGLIEIENHVTDAALQDLVSSLNNVAGAGTYDYVATGPVGGDAIKVAFIYKPGAVSLVGAYAVLDDVSFTDPNNTGQDKNRPALAQTFVEDETNSVFTVVVNHLKSKGSGCGEGDDDPEQGSCNLTRTLAAQALTDWLATDPTGSGDADYLVIGDLNSYDKEDPIDAFLAGADDVPGTADDYTDLSYLYGGEFAYSYVFDGQLGYLDYALATAGLLPQITGVATWNINADEADLLDYDMTYKQDAQDALYEPNAYRSSDHDPVIIGLDFGLPRNADGCFVIAAENSPYEGRAVIVETRHHVLNGMVWLLHSGLSRNACLEIHGTDGRDVLIGGRGDDAIFGYDKHDYLFGFHGDDVFTGGNGRDFFDGGRGQDTVLDYEWFEHCVSVEEGCPYRH